MLQFYHKLCMITGMVDKFYSFAYLFYTNSETVIFPIHGRPVQVTFMLETQYSKFFSQSWIFILSAKCYGLLSY